VAAAAAAPHWIRVAAAVAVAKPVAVVAASVADDEQKAALQRALSCCNVTALSVHDVCNILHELGLDSCMPAFRSHVIDGEALGNLGDDDMCQLGLDAPTDRFRLRHAVCMINACGNLCISPSELARIAKRSDDPDAVLFVTWNAERVAAWLEEHQAPHSVCKVLLAAGVNGEQLLMATSGFLEQLGVAAIGDRMKLLRRIAALRKVHFAAIHAFFFDSSSSSASLPLAAEPPSEFICPITQEVMELPVVAPDGFVYEEAAIKKWLASHTTSPMTGAPMSSKPLIRCNTLRSAIIKWKERQLD